MKRFNSVFGKTVREGKPVATEVDASNLSTHKAGGFTGVVIGMYPVR